MTNENTLETAQWKCLFCFAGRQSRTCDAHDGKYGKDGRHIHGYTRLEITIGFGREKYR